MLEMSASKGKASTSRRIVVAPTYFRMEMGDNLHGYHYGFAHNYLIAWLDYGGHVQIFKGNPFYSSEVHS